MSSDHENELKDLLKQTREYVNYFRELGAETIDLRSTAAETVTLHVMPQAKAATPERIAAQVEKPPSPGPSPTLFTHKSAESPTPNAPPTTLFGEASIIEPSLPPSNETLEDIWRDIGDCTRCGLCAGRTQVVNTHGNQKARLMFVGEAPGADEDAQGKPFVGRAGQLLTKMIEAMGLKREDVIIGNVNRCRPPGNRQPTLEEAAICRPFLFREIATVRPDVIVVMGNTALRNLLEIKAGISSVRGQFRDYHGIKVMPTFHPAYLLRDPSKKRETWEDLKKVMEHLDSATHGSANA
ncbi:MAG TPA: uracil-DNA glycosylase family protein [Pyrinomonadaceae bacterium]|nr:uracil-DNA glycosylase family protein [Pyrinomonadaceae bacterium]